MDDYLNSHPTEELKHIVANALWGFHTIIVNAYSVWRHEQVISNDSSRDKLDGFLFNRQKHQILSHMSKNNSYLL